MFRPNVLTGALLCALMACGDSPTAENTEAPEPAAVAVAEAAPADSTETTAAVTMKESAATLAERDERPASSVCARRVTELRQVRAQLADKGAMRSWSSLKSKELALSAAISDACF